MPLSHVGQFCGIEVEEWPVRIAEVAMWLMDHQMNNELFERFGQQKATIPLTDSPHIRQANALRIDWNEVLPAKQCTFVLGNPPFVGAKHLTAEQREDLSSLLNGLPHGGVLDYVAGWYFKAARYCRESNAIRVAFVSTNSITQGEQVGVLWNELFRLGAKIHFAHRTFDWMSEARGRAHVHVVIIGWGLAVRNGRRIYDYDTDPEHPTIIAARNISPYLVDGPDVAVHNRSQPLCESPPIGIGNKPIDDGNYLFTAEEKRTFLRAEPAARPFFRKFWGADDFLYNRPRWCLWLADCPPEKLRRMRLVMERVRAVRAFRLASKSAPTRRLAETPTRWHVENLPKRKYLLIPRHTSEHRCYIPMGYVPPKEMAGDSCLIISNATLYDFGVLHSAMHMAWVRHVAGRLKSDYRYSAKLVYNNFPWPAPERVTDAGRKRIEQAAQGVLDARTQFPNAALADLYDPDAMPPVLRRAHDRLDRAVDGCYRTPPFTSDRQRLEHLFMLYQNLVAPLAAPTRRTWSRR